MLRCVFISVECVLKEASGALLMLSKERPGQYWGIVLIYLKYLKFCPDN